MVAIDPRFRETPLSPQYLTRKMFEEKHKIVKIEFTDTGRSSIYHYPICIEKTPEGDWDWKEKDPWEDASNWYPVSDQDIERILREYPGINPQHEKASV